MKTLVIAISALLFVATALCPVLLYRRLLKNSRRHRFWIYLGLAVCLIAILTFVFGWWSDKADYLLLSHYGYRFDAETLSERYENVLPQNITEVKSLEYSYMGMGWPLKELFLPLLCMGCHIPWWCIWLALFLKRKNLLNDNKISRGGACCSRCSHLTLEFCHGFCRLRCKNTGQNSNILIVYRHGLKPVAIDMMAFWVIFS